MSEIKIVENSISLRDLKDLAKEVFGDMVKAVVDLEKEIMAVGGEYHIDCEEVLIKQGSKLENLYGGGYRVDTKEVEYMAMSNFKPTLGKTSYEIMDKDIRDKIYKLTMDYLEI